MRRRESDEKFNEILTRIDRNSEETRLYIRESGLRFERFMQQMDRRQAELEEEWKRNRERMEAHTDQIRAMTDAIWRLLDRWGYGPDNPPPEPA